MQTFILLGKYSAEGVKGISAARTQKAAELLKKRGGELKEAYALLGTYDLMVIVTLPGIKEAMQVSVELSKMTGIGFATSPALSVAEFDKLMG
jgi:uncharacterized protein with GYD domain